MWFWYGVLSGLFSALSVILNKKALGNVSAALVSWTLFVLPLPFLFVMVLREGIPSFNVMFFVGAVGSSVVYAVSKTISLQSIKNNLLSKLFPLSSFGTFFTYILGLLFLGEKITMLPLIGLIFIIIGAYLLNADRAKEHFLMPLKLLFTHKESFIFIIAMIGNSVAGIFDKVGVINTVPRSSTFVLFVEDIVLAILLTVYLLKNDHGWLNDFKKHFWVLAIGSFIYTLLALFFLMGIVTGAVVLVGGIKKLEILFVLILSYLFFHDKPLKYVWLGSIIMLAGVLLIKIG